MEHNLTLEKNIMEKREIFLGFLGKLFQKLENGDDIFSD